MASARLISTKSELAALRGLCSKKRRIAARILAGTDLSYFQNEASQEAFKKIRNIILKTGASPMWSDLKEDPSLDEDTRDFLEDSKIKVKTTEEADAVVRTLNKYRQLRGLWRISQDILSELQSKKVDGPALLERTSDDVTQLRMARSLKDIALHIGKSNNSYEMVKKLLYGKTIKNFLPTGFRDFDVKNGGIFFKSVLVIGGTSGGGKSALANQLAMTWTKLGENVVLVPLEMSKEEQVGRILANMSKIDIRKILLQRLSDDEKKLVEKKYKKYVRKANAQEGRYTIFKPEEDMSIEEILPVVSTYGPRVIIVDYISLLKGISGEDQWQKLGNVARFCKIFAAANDLIVVLLAQVSDDGRIRYSQAIKEHADYAWVFVSTKESRENEIINIEQIKGRNVQLFPFSLKAKLNIMRISDLDHDELEALRKEKKNKKKSKREKDYIDDISDEE